MNTKIVTHCEACGAQNILHDADCLAEILGGDCLCMRAVPLKELNFHGRKMQLCEVCHAKERVLLIEQKEENNPDLVLSVEARVIKEVKNLHKNFNQWQEIYVSERPNWVLTNFESPEDMRTKLVDFIVDMEKLEWEIKAKRRAALDAAKELDARLTRAERDALIHDPSFKPASNSEFKKICKDRELDQTMKTLDLSSATKVQRKSAEALLKMGMSIEDIKKAIKLE